MSFNPIPFDLLEGLQIFAINFLAGLLILLTVCFGTSLIVRGFRGPGVVLGMIKQMANDWFSLSFRRVGAIASLTIRESIRRKALLVFVIFAVLFMFAGWFLSGSDQRADLQAKVYVSFVLKTISWLCLPVVLLLACWGLPEDIKKRSLHTVVTKPCRRNEIVVGRMLGFSTVGTIVLLVMGVVGYIWLVRQVPEAARDNLTCRVPVYGELRFLDREGEPSDRGINTGDIWDFRSYVEGATKSAAIWEFDGVSADEVGDTMTLEARFESFRTHKGNMEGGLIARFFFSNPVRSNWSEAFDQSVVLEEVAPLIEAGQFAQASDELKSLASAIDDESGSFKPDDYEEVGPAAAAASAELAPLVEKNSDAAWLGELISSLEKLESASESAGGRELPAAMNGLAEIISTNADAMEAIIVDWRVPYAPFEVQEYREAGNVIEIDRKLAYVEAGQTKTVDLYDTIVHGDRLRVEVQCLDPGQLIGMARPDLFIRTPDHAFLTGYSKAIVGIWLMLILVVVIGVCASTFLKGPVATLLTLMFVTVGTVFHNFVDKLLRGDVEGGGAVESAIRMVRHLNPTVDLDVGRASGAVTGVDSVFRAQLWIAFKIIPDFTSFSRTVEFVANGFDVPTWEGLVPCFAMTLAYLIPCMLLGHFALKIRELEAK